MRWAAALLAGALLAPPAVAQAAWRLVPIPRQDVTLRAVAVTGAGRFQVSGAKGAYAVTDAAGATWRFAAPPGGEALDFRGLAALSPTSAVLMSAGDGASGQARLYRTGDGGRTWALAFESRQAGDFFDTVAFRDSRNGFVLGDPIDGRWRVLRTNDGGRTWAPLITTPAVQAGEAAFAASNSALFLGGRSDIWIVSGGVPQGRVFHSADDGRTWRVEDSPIAGGASGGLFGGLALGGDRAIIVGGDHKDEVRASQAIAVSDGRGWSVAPQTGTPGLLEGVGRLDRRTLIAVGPRGTSVSRDDGRSWSKADDEAFHAVACAKGACVAAGPRGRVGVWVP